MKKSDAKKAQQLSKIQAMFNDGKPLTEIAKAVGRYDAKAKDPSAGFRGYMNGLRKSGALKIGFRTEQATVKTATKLAAKIVKAVSKKKAAKAVAKKTAATKAA